jgi:hypothetical protein
MPWIWKVLSLAVLAILARLIRQVLNESKSSLLFILVPGIVIGATWFILLGISGQNWISERFHTQLDPVLESSLARLSIGLLILFVFFSLSRLIRLIQTWSQVSPSSTNETVLRFMSLASKGLEGNSVLLAQANALSKIQTRLRELSGHQIPVLLDKTVTSPILIGFRQASLRAQVPLSGLEAPDTTAVTLYKDLIHRGYLLRPLLLAPLLSPISLSILYFSIHPEKTTKKIAAIQGANWLLAVLGMLCVVVAVSARLVPGPLSLDTLKSGTSRTAIQGWQLLQTDLDTRIWSTPRGGNIGGRELYGLVVDSRKSQARFIRIFPGAGQRVIAENAAGYSFTAGVQGDGKVLPALMSFGLSLNDPPPQSPDLLYRNYNEIDSEFLELKPGLHTYQVTHFGHGQITTDFQLRVPPGWVVELSKMQQIDPGIPPQDLLARQRAVLKRWKTWSESASEGPVPKASLGWRIQDGIRR